MNRYFNNRRFGLLLKNEVVSNYKSWGIYFITIISIFLLYAILVVTSYKINPTFAIFKPGLINNIFIYFLFIGGYIASSSTFSDINDKYKSSLWLSLPGSSFEKYLVGVLVSSIGYSLFLMIVFFIASLFSGLLTAPIYLNTTYGMSIFNPFINGSSGIFNINALVIVLIYILTNSIFLVGSIVFRKAVFIKTILSASIIQTVLFTTISFIIFFMVKAGVDMQWDIRVLNFNDSHLTMNGLLTKYALILGIPFSLFFNVVGYLKLGEKEVKGGI